MTGTSPPEDRVPAVSVIIPTFNRPERLQACLNSLCSQTFSDFEVIVVDDGSREPMTGIVDPFSRAMRVSCLRQSNAGPARARNQGAQAARGTMLAFTDDDCRANPGWLAALWTAHQRAQGALLGGNTHNAVTGSLFSEASQDLVWFLYEHAARTPTGFDFFTSNNMACARDDFLALGGFDESFPLAAGEDREFGLRWKRSGRPLLHVPEARIDHYHTLDLRGFWRQQRNYGRGAAHLRKRFRQRAEPGVPFAGLRFYAAMLSFPFRAQRPRPAQRAALLALSQLAMVSGVLAEQSGPQRRGKARLDATPPHGAR